MTGKEIYLRDYSPNDEYSKLLAFLHLNMGEDLFPILEKAEVLGKKLLYDESKVPEGILDHFDEALIVIV